MNPDKKKNGRPSKLTDAQKEDARQRLLAGESAASIARSLKVDDKVIRRLKSETGKDASGNKRFPVDTIRDAAHKSLQNDLNDPAVRPLLESMGDEDRNLFHKHKHDLMEITLHLSMAAKYSAQNAHKLTRMAQTEFSKMDEATPMSGEGAGDNANLLRDGMMLHASATEASKIPMKFFEIATKQVAPPLDPSVPRTIVHVNAPDD
jgi:hypothetical protein